MGRVDLSVPLFFEHVNRKHIPSKMPIQISAKLGEGFLHVFASVAETGVLWPIIGTSWQQQDT